MPLRAFIDNEEVISIEKTNEEWIELKNKVKSKKSILTLPCCGQEGFLRTSSNGLNHFVHQKSDKNCNWKPESPEHLKAKIEIIEACKLNGWKAIPEYSEANWIADVLAIKNDKRIAFEIQWSKQTYETTKFRQARYQDSNVRGCWFFRTVPIELRDSDGSIIADQKIPLFKISKDENSDIVAHLGKSLLPLKKLADKLLKRKLKFCKSFRLNPNQKIEIIFFDTVCRKCKKPQKCYTVGQNQHFSSICHKEFDLFETLRSTVGREDYKCYYLDTDPIVYDSVQQFLNSSGGKDYKIGPLRGSYDKYKKSHLTYHGCFNCDAIFYGDYLVFEKQEAQMHNIDKITIEMGLEGQSYFKDYPLKGHHWCYSEDGNFCE